MKTFLKLSLVTSLLLTSAAQAQQVVTYYAQLPNWAAPTLQLPGFDTSLGLLNQVELSYEGTISQLLYAENKSSSPTTYDLSTTALLSLSKLGGPAVITFDPVTLQRSGSLGAFDGKLDYAGTSGVRYSQNTTLIGAYLDSNLSDYENVDMINFIVSISDSESLLSNCRFASGAATFATTNRLGVAYSFCAIPEPSTYVAILGATALVWVAVRRRCRTGEQN